MAQRVKSLPHKCKNLSSNSQNACKTGKVTHVCNSIAFAGWEVNKESWEMHRLLAWCTQCNGKQGEFATNEGEWKAQYSRLSLTSIPG